MKYLLLQQISPEIVDSLVQETLKQLSQATPYSSVVYSLILLILVCVTGLFFYLYWQEKKYNKQRDEKVLEIVALMTTVRIKLEEGKENTSNIVQLKTWIETQNASLAIITDKITKVIEDNNEIKYLIKENKK